MTKRNSVLVIVLCTLSTCQLAGCGQKESVVVQPAGGAKQVQLPKKPASQLPAAAQPQVSSAKTTIAGRDEFDFSTRKDPFKPAVIEVTGTPAGKKSESALRTGVLPIQSYDSSKFVVKGIVTGLRHNSALILDPTGRAYVIREGMMVGANDGRVTRITNTTVEISEKFRDDKGKIHKRIVKLTLALKGKETSR